MKNLFKSIAIVIVVLFSSQAQPKLSLDKPEVNLGTAYSGLKTKGSFVIKNIGNDTLRIYSVQPSCGCTALKQPKQILLPNESETVEVEFNTTGYRGRVEKYVNITSNDPSSQYLSVKLIAEVKEELKPLYGSTLIWFGNLKKGETSEKIFSLVNSSENKIRIKDYSPSNPTITATLDKKTLQPNDTLNIKIKVVAEKINYNNESLILSTDSKNQPKFEIRITYLVTNPE